MGKRYFSKVFLHRDELTDFLNRNNYEVINITWLGDYWVVFYALVY